MCVSPTLHDTGPQFASALFRLSTFSVTPRLEDTFLCLLYCSRAPPSSHFVHAILGGHLEKVKQWRKGSDLGLIGLVVNSSLPHGLKQEVRGYP